MGAIGKTLAGIGISKEKMPGDEYDINGLRSMSNLAYVGDAKGGHLLDVIWSKEAYDPIPVIIHFNGTCFYKTNRSKAGKLCRYLAKRDFLVINAEIRDLGKDVTVKDSIADAASLVEWIYRNAERFRMDLDNVYITGSGYGALMAFWMALLCNSNRLHTVAVGDRPVFKTKGLGLFTGMTDTESGDSRMRDIAESIRKVMKSDKDLAECLLPWSNHDLRCLPPVFQVTSDGDSAGPDVARMGNLLDINAVKHETLTFGYGIHTLNGFMELYASRNECSRTISRMLRFFEENQ